MVMTRARRDPILQVAQPDLKLAQLVLIHFRRFNLCASVLPTSVFFIAVILDHIPGEPALNFQARQQYKIVSMAKSESTTRS
jgi:hypothetical protein